LFVHALESVVVEFVNSRVGECCRGVREHHHRVTALGHADYDAANDVLYLHAGKPTPGEGEEMPEGHVVHYAPGTSEVVGLTVLGVRRVPGRDGRVVVTIPETAEINADDLKPALAAI
jgi:hypothetical protein